MYYECWRNYEYGREFRRSLNLILLYIRNYAVEKGYKSKVHSKYIISDGVELKLSELTSPKKNNTILFEVKKILELDPSKELQSNRLIMGLKKFSSADQNNEENLKESNENLDWQKDFLNELISFKKILDIYGLPESKTSTDSYIFAPLDPVLMIKLEQECYLLYYEIEKFIFDLVKKKKMNNSTFKKNLNAFLYNVHTLFKNTAFQKRIFCNYMDVHDVLEEFWSFLSKINLG